MLSAGHNQAVVEGAAVATHPVDVSGPALVSASGGSKEKGIFDIEYRIIQKDSGGAQAVCNKSTILWNAQKMTRFVPL